MSDPAAVVLDMEGVLHVDWQALPGAPEAVRDLHAAGVDAAILTNTTGKTRDAISGRLGEMGIEIGPERVVTAASAAADHVRKSHPGASVCLLGEPGASAEFAGVELVDDPADAGVLVLGGPDGSLTYERLNAAFRLLREGMPLVAMQRNRWWPTAGGPAMDAGGFVAALEYAAEVEATVVGKPSPEIFRVALGLLGAEPGDAVMVGDDLVSDLRPAAAVGLRTCLVRTGKGGSFQPSPGEVDFAAPDLAQFVADLLA
ncbi:MAG TPA: HAD-IIA family hydrolase [Gaiellales bacterium]|jgi:HAD superfamily hydrolase (TIGR01458 family)|nr:HAD-IIA family hydrolase [Gaiellales bacterium]